MTRHKLISAVYLIFKNKNNNFLFLRRKNTGYQDGNLSLVSGHVEQNEDFKTAAIREAKEESGVDISEKDLNLVHIQSRNADDGERIDIFFEVTSHTGEIINCEPEKCS
jgi:8-oxo-dGTP diphosphatase